ncbi:acyl-CoA carboxylase subunit epsilon [Rhodococcus spongiicola]|uniref:Acyl-CoA carboxylase subunit epsilon n=1 Tax=Rhodococcus spongiicola TaxID=2487352 RepID=A0A3S3BM69_9NOCA|nr:acyl-CoA carboxylase subunit epsilon [Rhodococcus spongiicola]RVW04549.1 acyl-CoA carboxylase subunit epsilon [Rhodococcus spongiicola]
MTATTREDLLTDADLLTPSVDAAALEGAELEEAIAGLESQEADEVADPKAPLVTIVRGNPSDEEIGALVAVFTAVAAASSDEVTDPRPPETWGAPTRMHRVQGAFSPHSFGSTAAPRPS